jgi:exonuclease III
MKDTINYVNRNNEKSQKQIHQMMEVLDLVDTYRELHPEFKRYSWRGPHKKTGKTRLFSNFVRFSSFYHRS